MLELLVLELDEDGTTKLHDDVHSAAMMARPKRMGRVMERTVGTSRLGACVVYQSCAKVWCTPNITL